MTLFQWMSDAIETLRSDTGAFVTAHLDELEVAHSSWEQSGAALALAIGCLPRGWEGRLSLALPLNETSFLMTVPPPDPRRMANLDEPPSLYVFGTGYREGGHGLGDLHRAVVKPPVTVGNKPVWGEFVSSRDADSAERAWDFVNTLWIHYRLDAS